MKFLIIFKLRGISSKAKPSKQFRLALRRELMPGVGQPWYISIARPAAGVLTVVVLMGAGTGAYAYSSEEVLPDHPLYGFRERIERMEERIQLSPERRAMIQRKHLERRVAEFERMMDRKKQIKRPHVERMATDMQRAIRSGDSLSEPSRVHHHKMILQYEIKQAHLLTDVQF